MCNRYVSPDEAEMERAWHVCARDNLRGDSVFPRKLGQLIRVGAPGERALVVGQWTTDPVCPGLDVLPEPSPGSVRSGRDQA